MRLVPHALSPGCFRDFTFVLHELARPYSKQRMSQGQANALIEQSLSSLGRLLCAFVFCRLNKQRHETVDRPARNKRQGEQREGWSANKKKDFHFWFTHHEDGATDGDEADQTTPRASAKHLIQAGWNDNEP